MSGISQCNRHVRFTPRKRIIEDYGWDVRFVPIADIR
jgi:hypothetical protein